MRSMITPGTPGDIPNLRIPGDIPNLRTPCGYLGHTKPADTWGHTKPADTSHLGTHHRSSNRLRRARGHTIGVTIGTHTFPRGHDITYPETPSNTPGVPCAALGDTSSGRSTVITLWGHIIDPQIASAALGDTPSGRSPSARTHSCGDTPSRARRHAVEQPGGLCAALGDTTSERSTGIPMATHRTLVSSPVPMLPKGQTIDPRKPRGHIIGKVPS